MNRAENLVDDELEERKELTVGLEMGFDGAA